MRANYQFDQELFVLIPSKQRACEISDMFISFARHTLMKKNEVHFPCFLSVYSASSPSLRLLIPHLAFYSPRHLNNQSDGRASANYI